VAGERALEENEITGKIIGDLCNLWGID